MNYSVLMSVYYKEQADYLRASMNSIWEQTVPPDEVVLVCDGPLTDELDVVIEEMKALHPSKLKLVRMERNMGLGNALNEGLKHCKNEMIARMDSDDISRPDRCERQLEAFKQNPDLGMVSGMVEEFVDDPEIVKGRRIVPEKQKDILKYAKKRNPFNHPCIMYRKTAVESIGGYKEIYLLEDYFLWVRMLMNGAAGYNLQQPLLWMRAGKNMYRRRSGWKYVKSQAELFGYMREQGFISKIEWLNSMIIRGLSAMAPNWLRVIIYKNFLRD